MTKAFPVNYKGNITNGTIFRRVIYPLSGVLNSSQYYKDTVARIADADVKKYFTYNLFNH
ncbi:hypothetical protein G7074_03535 [Pedobacter sp. HDW13]|uniref:hypothetical protein n=1 Tax=unclassified Pedobacter TaxID=2628915 RepID=UPI000F596376|nr:MULTISPECIES: hypothetical protein [unclassified Pedobacter]QIL38434.1 hypothetical protein G7074_03535 [Pedobacter sp. HDW13]RQO65459.1 hypothetical protein DBR40_23835 [Pedobacter sp. KBW01]